MDYSSSRRSSNAYLQKPHPQQNQQQSYQQQQEIPRHDGHDYQHNYASSSLEGSQQLHTDSGYQGGRFTEEWEASQRGSSIVEGRDGRSRSASRGNNMQRSNSVHSYNAGDDQQLTAASLPSRGNTLKKKGSMRRAGSMRRSGSRRSMRAGSVKSLALHSSGDPDESHGAFYCPVPTTGNPTEILIHRFQCK